MATRVSSQVYLEYPEIRPKYINDLEMRDIIHSCQSYFEENLNSLTSEVFDIVEGNGLCLTLWENHVRNTYILDKSKQKLFQFFDAKHYKVRPFLNFTSGRQKTEKSFAFVEYIFSTCFSEVRH